MEYLFPQNKFKERIVLFTQTNRNVSAFLIKDH